MNIDDIEIINFYNNWEYLTESGVNLRAACPAVGCMQRPWVSGGEPQAARR